MLDSQIYDNLDTVVQRWNPDLSAAFVHGLVSGVVSTVARAEASPRCCALLGVDGPSPIRDVIEGMSELTYKAFDSEEFSFHLLLPTDDENLVERVQAIGDWCQGFTLALTAGSPKRLEQLTGDVGEAGRDIMEISRVEIGVDENGNEAERNLMEVEEYVRVAAQTVFDHHQQPNPEP